MSSELQFTSWNVKGLNKLVKLKQVMSRIKQLKAKIVFLQETHLTPEDVVKVRRWPDLLADLNLDITNEELSLAIGKMKRGKTPGSDGIPIEMYKSFQDALIPPLHKW